MHFILLGDVMVDVTAQVDRPLAQASDTPAHISMHAGGAAANTAAWLAHLGHRATLLGAVGADPFADLVRGHLSGLGVRCELQAYSSAATGIVIAIVDPSSERTMLPDPGANSLFRAADVDDSLISSGTHFHLSGYTLLNPQTRDQGLDLLRRAHAAGLTTSLDPASVAPLQAHPRAFDQAWDRIDIVLANAPEALELTGTSDPEQACAALAERVRCAVVKLGPAGAIAAMAGETANAPALPVRALDSTGAGDAFAAGFLPAWLGGLGLAQALALGCEVAGTVVSRVGAEP